MNPRPLARQTLDRTIAIRHRLDRLSSPPGGALAVGIGPANLALKNSTRRERVELNDALPLLFRPVAMEVKTEEEEP